MSQVWFVRINRSGVVLCLVMRIDWVSKWMRFSRLLEGVDMRVSCMS